MKKLCAAIAVVLLAVGLVFGQSEKKRRLLFDDSYLGRLSANPYDPDSTSNPVGVYGSPYSSHSVNNPFSMYGRAARSEFSTSDSPVIIGEDGTYLGRLNRNRFDADSVANPFGRCGSKFSPESINNPFGNYGSPQGPYSARNPYAVEAPRIFAPKSSMTLRHRLKLGSERQEW